MSKQMDVNDLVTSSLKESSRQFVDTEYMQRNLNETLIPIRTRYEAYGKMAECFVGVSGAMDALKSGMRDSLKALNGMDTGFCNAAEATYASLLDVIMAVGEMAVQTLNCVYKISDIVSANPPPLVAMAEEGAEEAAEENIDDEDLGETNEEEEEF